MNQPATGANALAPNMMQGMWRSSKIIGLNVYNEQNEKLGDINEVLFDRSGKVHGVVIGVGGFLGLGERDVLFQFDRIRFVDEPVRTAATNTTVNNANRNTAAGTTATAPRSTAAGAANPDNDARVAGNPAGTATSTADRNMRWWPDHAIVNANKDQLKSMPEFKYSSYN